MPIEALEGVSDQDLFDEANADEAPADDAVVEVPEAEPEQELEPLRDEQGRYAAAAAASPENPVAANPAPAPAVDDNAAMVPSWRVREINDEKRATAERLVAAEAELARLRQAPPQQFQQAPPAPAVEEPDPLLDPKAYREFIREETRKEILNDRREESLGRAHKTHGKEFEEAYAAAQKQVDQVLRIKMQTSRDPGEALMQWHRERKAMAEVGTDPNAYFDKRLEAYLADPANQGKVMERIRGGVQQQLQPGAPKPAPAVSLPPSLTRVASAATTTAEDDDISNDGLWRHANA